MVSEEDAGDLLWVAVGRRRADSLPCGGVDKGFLAPGVVRFEQAEISYSDKAPDDVDLCMVPSRLIKIVQRLQKTSMNT